MAESFSNKYERKTNNEIKKNAHTNTSMQAHSVGISEAQFLLF